MYHVNDEDKQSIYRYDTLTKKRQKLNDVKSQCLYVTSDRIYYMMEFIYKIYTSAYVDTMKGNI